MAARLEWKNGYLWIGRVEVATTEWRSGCAHHYKIGGHAWNKSYESEADMRQDCEHEARRLLKEAGVALD